MLGSMGHGEVLGYATIDQLQVHLRKSWRTSFRIADEQIIHHHHEENVRANNRDIQTVTILAQD
jgi:hypothetical protein